MALLFLCKLFSKVRILFNCQRNDVLYMFICNIIYIICYNKITFAKIEFLW